MLMQTLTETDNFIQRCMELSENVENYIVNRLYLCDVDDPKQVTQLFLKTVCLDLILEELRDRGIIFPNTACEFQELLYDREIPIQLYARFQEDAIFKLVKELPDESRQQLLNEFEYDDQQLCARLCNVFSSFLPMDAAWDYIAQHEFMFFSNETFRDKFHAVIEKAVYEPPTPIPVEGNLDRIGKWLAGEKKHQDELTKLLMITAERLYLDAGDNESSFPLKNELLTKMERYDWDHRTPNFLTKMMVNPNAEAEDEPYHQQHNDHHIQYYFQHQGITWPQIVYVACTAASKQHGDDLRAALSTDQAQITPDDKAKMLTVLEKAEQLWQECNEEITGVKKEATNEA